MPPETLRGSAALVRPPLPLGQHGEISTALARRATVNALRLVVPAVAVGVLGAPLILRALGPEYEKEATGLLQLLVLSTVPQVVVGVAVSVAKIRREVGRLIAVYLALAVLVYVGGYVALRTVGLIGVGAAWLVAQAVVAAVLLATYLSCLWRTAPGRRRQAQRGLGGRPTHCHVGHLVLSRAPCVRRQSVGARPLHGAAPPAARRTYRNASRAGLAHQDLRQASIAFQRRRHRERPSFGAVVAALRPGEERHRSAHRWRR
jgi:hypothetical protein